MRNFVDKVLNLGKEKGFSACEVYYSSSKSISINVFRGEIDKFDTSRSGGLSFRGIANGKMGYSYTELIEDSVAQELVDNAYDSANAVESADEVFIFDEKCEYQTINTYNPEIPNTPIEKKIQLVMDLEKKIKALDERVMDVLMCTYNESEVESVMCNSHGIDLNDRRNYCVIYASISLKDGENVRTNFDGKVAGSLEELNIDEIAKKIVDGAVEQIGAKSTPSRSTRTVIRYDAFASLLGVHLGVFEADSVQKGLSPMKGRLGERIGVEALNIIDDPFVEGSVYNASFDGEGFPTSRKHLVENGVLKTYFHNLKTAKKDGVRSTGNASRYSYKGAIGIGPNTIVVKGGTLGFEELISACGSGILITSVEGLHAGINPISGDFSLMASGFEIIDGKKGAPITQIVLSGNFYTLLKDIEEIGSDVTSTIFGPMYTPSILVKELTVSGE